MAIKLYGSTLSPNVLRVLACLEEVGAEYELVPIDFATGEHKSPAHLARNPFGQVPALEDGNLMLFESRAIAKYILRKYTKPGTDLLHESNIEESAFIDAWLETEAHQFSSSISPITYQYFIVPMFGGVCDQKVVDENMEKLKKVLDVYEAHLSKSKYLAGDFFSLADLSHFPIGHYFMATPCASVLNEYPHFGAWWEDLKARPAMKKVMTMMPGQ